MFGKLKDIIKKRQEENEQRQATSTGFKTVVDYNKWKQETRIKTREKIIRESEKKKKQKLKDKIEKNESNRNRSIVETYVDAFDKVGKGIDKFQKGVDKFEKGIGQLEDGLSSSHKSKRKSKRKSNTRIVYRKPPRTAYKHSPKRKIIRKKTTSSDDGWGWLEN